MAVNDANSKKEVVKPLPSELAKKKVKVVNAKPSQEKDVSTRALAPSGHAAANIPEQSIMGDIFTSVLSKLGHYLTAGDDDDSGSDCSGSGCDNEMCPCCCTCDCTDEEGVQYWVKQIISHKGDRVPMDFSYTVSVLSNDE